MSLSVCEPVNLSACSLCPRQCGVDRASAVGFCKAGAVPRLYRWGVHRGEEPPVSGTRGSGTLFFSHCTLACLYCQNYTWSQEHRGTEVTVEELAGILRELAGQGCHNWNLVTPTPWLPQIRAAAERVKSVGISLPFVYNTSGFERLEVASEYHALMDVVLTDLRYAKPETAAEASAAADYVERSRAFVQWAWENVGPLETDAEGIARKGVICRLLVLPGHADEAIANLEWMAGHLGTEIAVSLMAQYTPVYKALSKAGWNRRVTPEEYDRVACRLESLGFENGWIQALEESPPDGLLGCEMTEQT
ncbi:MAG: radical SAM protein [Kiritimatiellaeota bacterium]|nr:radical SAM protein [Kiritimatiellota bacterium]